MFCPFGFWLRRVRESDPVLLVEGPDGWGAGDAGTISGSSQARSFFGQDGRSEGPALRACLQMQVSAKYQIESSKARDALIIRGYKYP